MPRLARIVFPNIPYHITQRGNRQEDVFFCAKDREFYLQLLASYCDTYRVDIWAYCLMSNHVHLILVPSTKEGLQQVLKPLHMRYAQYINKQKGWKGHLWQGRYFSAALDEIYAHSAIRYVERNPVRAGLAERAEEYDWSSAASHCGCSEESFLSLIPDAYRPVEADSWQAWLAIEDDIKSTQLLIRNTEKGLPCGNSKFIETLEKLSQRNLTFRPQGRPRKNIKKG